MQSYRYKEGELIPQERLWEALAMPEKPGLVVSLVGGGGKTSLMYRLAEELKARGKRVIVTTTTHIFCPEDRQVVLASKAETVGRWITEHAEGLREPSAGWILVTGQRAAEDKLTGLPLAEIGKLTAYADVLLIEADGAKRLPVKVPREGEPVIAAETDVVIGCAGLDCIGYPMEERCFRTDLAEKLLGQPRSHRMEPEDVARILTDARGTGKGVGNREYRIVLNKADHEKDLKAAVKVFDCIRLNSRDMSGKPLTLVVTKFDIENGKGQIKCR